MEELLFPLSEEDTIRDELIKTLLNDRIIILNDAVGTYTMEDVTCLLYTSPSPRD